MENSFYRSIIALTIIAVNVSAQAPVPAQPKVAVRALTETMSSVGYTGVVGLIDKDSMVVVETTDRGQVKEHTFVPIDLLRKGEYISEKYSGGWRAYRWQDVNAGDTVTVDAMWDRDEKVWYCMQICIQLRPKDKLPKSQEPKKDDQFEIRSLYNDIENGIDVSDEEIKRLLPPYIRVDKKTGEKTQIDSGGLPGRWQLKLDAIRAKAKRKNDDVKAPPPTEKK
jgi:hypothetical protein